MWISFCPMGSISMSWEHEDGLLGQWVISGECYSPAGPGFHKRQSNLWMHWADPVLRGLTVSDVTDYYRRHRDFQHYEKEHFYPWLKMRSNLATGRARLASGEYGSLCLCRTWIITSPGRYPGGVSHHGTVLGLQVWSRPWSVLESGGGWQTGSSYGFNLKVPCSLREPCLWNLMWEKCFFGRPDRSSRDADINRAALGDLGRHAGWIPGFPSHEAYLLLCGLDSRTPIMPPDATRYWNPWQCRWALEGREVTHTHTASSVLTLPKLSV